MGTENSPSSQQHLPWLWVVEALAEFEQVDTPLLDDLSSNVPELTDKSWGRNARERLALRHLEDLVCPNDADAINVASTSNPPSKFNISVSERVEDVLVRVRDQMAAANATMSELECLRSDVRQFILQKRVFLPKCALHQLKDKIVKGDQLSSHFLREISGLDTEHQEDKIVLMGGGPDGDAKMLDQSTNNVSDQALDVNSKSLAPGNCNDVPKECPGTGKDHFGAVSEIAMSLGQRLENAEAHSMSGICASKDNVDEVVQEDALHAILPSSERERSVCVEQENICGGSSENHADAEKFTENVELYSMKYDTSSMHVNGLGHFPHQKNLFSTINEANESAKGAKVQDLQENGLVVADGDDDSSLLITKRIKLSTNDGDAKANNLRMADNEGEILEVTSSDGLHMNGHVVRADDHCTKAEATSSKGSHLDKPPSFVPNEDITNVAVRGNFFVSQNMLKQDSDRTDCMEQNFCIKCNRGGQLLICCVNSCRVVVHESCVGSAGCFDGAGKFYCPFCSLAQSTASYCETKKKAVLVKEKVALATSRLFKFMSMVHAHREQSSENIAMQELNQSKVIEDMNYINEAEISQLKKIVSYQPNSGRKHQQGIEVDSDCANSSAPHKGASISQSNQNTVVLPVREKLITVKNYQDARNLKDQEPLEPSTKACEDFHLRNGETTIICRKTLEVSLSNEVDKTTLDKRQQSPAIEKESEQGVPTGTAANPSCTGTGTGFADQERASVETETAVLRQNVDPISSSPQNVDLGEISASENDDFASYEFRRRRRPVNRYSNQSSPHSRRPKIPWTAEEEGKLKEGVKKFASTDGKSIPWKKILLFGQNVFLESRTTIDLKDKWRNIWSREGQRALA